MVSSFAPGGVARVDSFAHSLFRAVPMQMYAFFAGLELINFSVTITVTKPSYY